MNLSEIKNILSMRGWVLLPPESKVDVEEIIAHLGKLLNKADITNKDDSSQFIHGTGCVELHTDDPRADYIIWKCIEPASDGGDNILKDLRQALEMLNVEQQKELGTTLFKVNLPGAPIEVPCLILSGKDIQFYYAPWKIGRDRNGSNAEALFFLALALEQQSGVRISMKSNCTLVVNNRFIVHGREPYSDKKRHLKRYLVVKSN